MPEVEKGFISKIYLVFGFTRVFPGFPGFSRVFPGFPGFSWIFPDFIKMFRFQHFQPYFLTSLFLKYDMMIFYSRYLSAFRIFPDSSSFSGFYSNLQISSISIKFLQRSNGKHLEFFYFLDISLIFFFLSLIILRFDHIFSKCL